MRWVLLCFSVLLVQPRQASETKDLKEALALNYHNTKTALNSLGGECGWICDASNITGDAFFQKGITYGGTRFRICVRYQVKIDGMCISNETRSSIETVNDAKYVYCSNVRIVRPANRDVPEFIVNVFKDFSDLIESEFHGLANARCAYQFAVNKSATIKSGNQTISSDYLQENVIRLTQLGSLGEPCRAEEENDEKTCIKISGSESSWKRGFMQCLLLVLVAFFSYISPYIVCLFHPSEVTDQGICQIIVDGPSPVGFGSAIGNYFFFFSTDETGIRYKAREFIMHVFILPIPFVLPALLVEYLLHKHVLPGQNSLTVKPLFRPFVMLGFGCYCIQAFCASFYRSKLKDSDPLEDWFPRCSLESPPRGARGYNRRNLPLRMSIHLRTVWKFLTSQDDFRKLFPEGYLMKIVNFVFPLPHLYLFGKPLAVLCTSGNLRFWFHFGNLHSYTILLLLDVCVSVLAMCGAVVLLKSTVLGVALFFHLVFVFSMQNLPFAACSILALYYVWRSYSSFTKQYKDLATTLLESYKSEFFLRDEITIPKVLYDKACKELMPVTVHVRKLAFKIILHLIFTFLLLPSSTLLDFSAINKTLTIVFVWSATRMMTFLFDGRKQSNIEVASMDDKTRQIVGEYIFQTNSKRIYHELKQFDPVEFIPISVVVCHLTTIISSLKTA